MSNKGFTLIELLAAIVIIGIIALITIPIVNNIIDNAENSVEVANVKQYINALEDYLLNSNTNESIMIKDGVCTVNSNNIVTCGTQSFNVDVKNAKITSGFLTIEDYNVVRPSVITINNNNQYSIDTNGEVYLFTPICTLESGESKQVGSKYTCKLSDGVSRTFYVLGTDENDSTKIDLIMDSNYTDSVVPLKMTWCDQNGSNPGNNVCEHDGLNSYITHIQEVFGNDVVVSLPSREQIVNANNGVATSLPLWLYDCTTNGVSGLRGYWTSTPREESINHVWFVFDTSNLDYLNVTVNTYAGIRPVITISEAFIK